MSSPRALVVVPTHDHGETLRLAALSALGQTVGDLEVVVVGDGMDERTRAVATELCRADRRVRLHDRPKGESRGELHRAEVLATASAPAVFYLSDDDLWLPRHVETLLPLLDRVDFVHATAFNVGVDGETSVLVADLAHPFFFHLHLGGRNRVPLSAGAHSLELYRRLPHGWRVTPAGVPTDLHMWQQILTLPGVRTATAYAPTVLNFPSPPRRGWTETARVAELEAWSRLMREEPETVARRMAETAARELGRLEAHVGHLDHLLRGARAEVEALAAERPARAGRQGPDRDAG